MARSTATHEVASTRHHWWQRLSGARGDEPWGLDERWRVVQLKARHDLVVGPGGAFLVTQGIGSVDRVRQEANHLGRWLTSRLGRPVIVHGVLAVPPTDAQPLDQPLDVTIVSVAVLGAWLMAHPPAWTDREVVTLARAAASGPPPATA